MPYPLHIVDVFAERPHCGNQLAVVIEDAETSHDWKQRVAAELNFSETTFIRSMREADGAWHIRMYTPTHEMSFGGHPILGTAWVVRHHLAAHASSSSRAACAQTRQPAMRRRSSGYLLAQRGVETLSLRIEQGCEMGRPLLVLLRARRIAPARDEIEVGGRVYATVRGELL